MAACAIGAVALAGIPETARCPITGTETPGTAAAPRQLDYADS